MQSFQLIKPCFALAPYIRHYWILQDDSIAPVSERTLPIGCMQLVFHKGKQLLLLGESELQPQPPLFPDNRSVFGCDVYRQDRDDYCCFSTLCGKSIVSYTQSFVPWADCRYRCDGRCRTVGFSETGHGYF